jgi:O-antigen/teichoic acid export membrane protein
MFSEQAVTILSGLFVGVYLARSIGPEKFGVLSYVIAFSSFISVFSRLGMESILVREISTHRSESSSYMGTVFYMMLCGGALSALLTSFILFFLGEEASVRKYLAIISLGIMFQGFLVIDYNFQSEFKARFSARVKIISIVITSFLKMFMAYLNAPLSLFFVAYAFDYLMIGFSLYVVHYLTKGPLFLGSLNWKLAKSLISNAFPMVMSGVATIAMVKTDHIMIKNMLCAKSLGIYAAAAKIYEGWSTLALVLSLSIFPIFLHEKKKSQKAYKEKVGIFFMCFFWVSVAFSIFVSIFSGWIILLLYGAEYSSGQSILSILIWAAPLISIGFISTRYLIAEKMQNKVAIRNWVSLALNIPLNYVFITIFDVEGAAISTLISLFFAHYVIDYLDQNLKELAKIRSRGIFCFKAPKKSGCGN